MPSICVLNQAKTGQSSGSFSVGWFHSKRKMATLSGEKKSFFLCFCSLLSHTGAENPTPKGSKARFKNLKYMSGKKIMKKSENHVDNSIKYALFGAANILPQRNTDHHIIIQWSTRAWFSRT